MVTERATAPTVWALVFEYYEKLVAGSVITAEKLVALEESVDGTRTVAVGRISPRRDCVAGVAMPALHSAGRNSSASPYDPVALGHVVARSAGG